LSMAYARGALSDPSMLSDAIRQIEIVRQKATIQFHPEISAGRTMLGKIAAELAR
jgi:sarcosine oxidase subunit alpha